MLLNSGYFVRLQEIVAIAMHSIMLGMRSVSQKKLASETRVEDFG